MSGYRAIVEVHGAIMSTIKRELQSDAVVVLKSFGRLIQSSAMGAGPEKRRSIKDMFDEAICQQLGDANLVQTFMRSEDYTRTVAVLEDANLGTILDLPGGNGPHECGFVDPGAVARRAHVGGI